jgi:anti-sigma B factor antagonist
MPDPLISTVTRNGVTVVHVHARKLYQQTVPAFRAELLSLVDQGHRAVLVDLSGVDVMNSSALGVIILTYDRVNKEGGKFAVAGLGTILKDLFERMHLGELFPIVKGEEEGTALLSGDIKIPAQ